jgi:putative endonuclease
MAAERRGRHAEARAEAWLVGQGLELLARRQRSADGELDLVLLDAEGRIVFVEVRQRREGARVAAAESITFRKQARLRRAALAWLQAHPQHQERICRCDVILIDGGRVGTAAIEWLKDVW